MAFFLSLAFLPKAELEIRILMEIIYFEKCFQSLGMGSREESEREGGKGTRSVHHRVGYCVGSSGSTLRTTWEMVQDVPWSCVSKTEMEFLVTGSQCKVKGRPSNSPTGKRAGAPQTSPIKWAKTPLDKRWKIHNVGTSPVVQESRSCLPMWGTQVRPLVWEDPTCQGAAKSMHRNYWACVP